MDQWILNYGFTCFENESITTTIYDLLPLYNVFLALFIQVIRCLNINIYPDLNFAGVAFYKISLYVSIYYITSQEITLKNFQVKRDFEIFLWFWHFIMNKNVFYDVIL